MELQEEEEIQYVSKRLNKSEKIQFLKENIKFLQSVKNGGVVIGNEQQQDYIPFMEDGIYKEQVQDWIMDLSKTLYKETKSMFK